MRSCILATIGALIVAAAVIPSAGAYSYHACTAKQPAHRELACATHNLYHAQYTLQWVGHRSQQIRVRRWIEVQRRDLLAFDFTLASAQNKLAQMRKNMRWLAGESKRDIAEAQQRLYRLRHPVSQSYSGGSIVSLGQAMAAKYGWVGYEWAALYTLWSHESGWSPYAQNPGSAACGIPQAMNYCAYGHDPATQIAWGLKYILGRYGRPSAALAHWGAYGWY